MIQVDGVPGAAFGTRDDGDPRRDHDAAIATAAEIGIPADWAWVRQIHGNDVIRATGPGVLGDADAVFTTLPGMPVAVTVADCLPVALLAPGAAAIAHAGWRGAASGVVAAAADAMAAAGHAPEVAVIGPGIGPCCFEVGEEVAARFPDHGRTTSWGTDSVDLVAAVAADLGGITVHVVDGCTHHDDRFHSFRRDGTQARQFGVAWVPPA